MMISNSIVTILIVTFSIAYEIFGKMCILAILGPPPFFLFQVLDPRDKNLVDMLVSAALASGESGVTPVPPVPR